VITGNNPGNIRRVQGQKWQGEIVPAPWVPGFVTFSSLSYGWRALIKLLQTYINKYGLNTIEKIIYRWAPPIENDTPAYVAYVEGYTGYPRGAGIASTDYARLGGIAAAIGEIEHSGVLSSSELDALNTGLVMASQDYSPAGESQAGMSPLLVVVVVLGIVAMMKKQKPHRI